MSKVLPVNQDLFESEVLNSDLPVVVDFYATWCPPCRMLSPILERLATEFDGQIKFVKVNSDEEPQLASQYNVTGLPTIALFDNGNHLGQFSGLPREEVFRDQLRNWIASGTVAN